MTPLRAVFYEEDDARAVAARLVHDGFEATVARERLAGEDDDEDHEGNGEADDLTRTDDRGVLGDLDAVVGRHTGAREGVVAPLHDEGAVLRRYRLGIVVELDLRDGIPSVVTHEPGPFGGPADRDPVLVLRASGVEVCPLAAASV